MGNDRGCLRAQHAFAWCDLVGLGSYVSAPVGVTGEPVEVAHYVVEKKIWKLYQQQLDIAKDPAVIADKTFEDLVAEYRTVIAKYPDSDLTPGIYLQLGELHALKGDYDGTHLRRHYLQ